MEFLLGVGLVGCCLVFFGFSCRSGVLIFIGLVVSGCIWKLLLLVRIIIVIRLWLLWVMWFRLKCSSGWFLIICVFFLISVLKFLFCSCMVLRLMCSSSLVLLLVCRLSVWWVCVRWLISLV